MEHEQGNILSVYSPSENVIYNKSLIDDYRTAGTWPKDGIEISDDDAIKFSPINQPEGHALYFNGCSLSWVEKEIGIDDLISIYEIEKNNRLINAKDAISVWQTKLQLGRITEDEKHKLNIWLDYIDEVNAIDTSMAPDIQWPAPPAQ